MRIDSITTVLRRALGVGAAVGIGVGLVCGLVGLALAGLPGLASGLVGAVLTILFLGVTAAGVLAVGRLAKGDGLLGMGVLLGGWFVKLLLFVLVMVVIGRQPWVVPGVLLVSIIGTVIASLVVDALVVGRSRIPVTDRV